MKTLIVCDFQPDYHYVFITMFDKFVKFVNNSDYDKLVFFYNGITTTRYGIMEKDLRQFYKEHGMNLEKFSEVIFFDKGCGEYIELMDKFLFSKEEIITLGKKFLVNGKAKFLNHRVGESLEIERVYRQLIRYGLFSLNPSISLLQELDGEFDLVGGFAEQCLLELEINFSILNKTYNRLEQFIYHFEG